MTTITLSRNFLKVGLVVFLFFLVLMQIVSWNLAYAVQIKVLHQTGSIFAYGFAFLRRVILPELVTIFLLTGLLSVVHWLLDIHSIDLNWSSITRYQLLFLPVLLVAFGLVTPFTQSVRFLLMHLSDFSLAQYERYMVLVLSWRVYFRYLFPLVFIGYATVNISLLLDYIRASRAYLPE